MGIIKTEKVKGISIITVGKDFPDEKADSKLGTCITNAMAAKFTILKESADVITEDGKILLRFRKNVLPKSNIDKFYDNVIQFARSNKTSNRAISTGVKVGTKKKITPIASNILGYIDGWSPQHKFQFKKAGLPIIYPEIRQSYFSQTHHTQWNQLKPLIRDIDRMYKSLAPVQYKEQRQKADETYFKIHGTAFTTITTNVNYNTCVHRDKGDDPSGFGNLVVLQRGEYSGGETCFLQYGVGVDVREGDFLLMDVHQLHGNTQLKLASKDVVRLSIVSYLRVGIWENTRAMSKTDAIAHMKKIERFYKKLDTIKNKGTAKNNKKEENAVFLSASFAKSEHKLADKLGSA